MNERYFACRNCHNYIDAGYRHCYWTLEHPGIVERNKPVNVPAVLVATDYWYDANGVEWIDGAAEIRPFLLRHQSHDLIFGESEDIGLVPMYDGDYRFLDWLDEGEKWPEPTVRWFYERLNLRTWEQVRQYAESNDRRPWWWGEPEIMPRAMAKFILLSKQVE